MYFYWGEAATGPYYVRYRPPRLAANFAYVGWGTPNYNKMGYISKLDEKLQKKEIKRTSPTDDTVKNKKKRKKNRAAFSA